MAAYSWDQARSSSAERRLGAGWIGRGCCSLSRASDMVLSCDEQETDGPGQGQSVPAGVAWLTACAAPHESLHDDSLRHFSSRDRWQSSAARKGGLVGGRVGPSTG